ncbi:hypothetical protein SEUCBS139899_002543 [Sporothrix eucalyptigena]
MGTRGLEVVRYKGRYYTTYNHHDSYLEGLGRFIVSAIPTQPDEYQKWLAKRQAFFASLQEEFDKRVYPINEGSRAHGSEDLPIFGIGCQFVEPPSEIPPFGDDMGIEWTYVMDLDSEVLTINDCVHWRLDSIPREDDL